MSNQIYHKRAISGLQQNNGIKFKESSIITTMSNKKQANETKNQSAVVLNMTKNHSNSKTKTQNKSSSKNKMIRSISPISSSKEDFINSYINKKLKLDKNEEGKSKSKDKLQNSAINMAGANNKPSIGSFNQKNPTKSNQNTFNSTNSTFSQRSNNIAKPIKDNQNIPTKTLESEYNTTYQDKHNLTIDGNNKKLTLINGETMSNIEKIAKQHIITGNRNKVTKSPSNTNKTNDVSNRSISPITKHILEKTDSFKKNITQTSNNIKSLNEKIQILKTKTNNNDLNKRTSSPLSKSVNTNSRSKSPTFRPCTNNININVKTSFTQKQVVNSNSKELKAKDNVPKGGNAINPREINYSPLLKKKSKEISNESLKKLVSTNSKSDQSQVSNNNETKEIERSKSSEKKIISKEIKMIYELTRTGFNGMEQKKMNQDNYFIYKNFNNNHSSFFVGVCDGHGSVGHDVSSFLRDNLPKTLDYEIKRGSKNNISLNKIIKDVFLSVNCKLFNEATIDTNFSGSTCVSLIYTKEKIICANVGDSRAVLGRFVNGNWKSQNLSRDHKPNDTDEKQRIINRNGRVEPFKDENGEFIGPARVWLMEHNIPGLAMSRSFGDKTASQVGVISEPEIIEWSITKEDMFIVLASDGVWEFIESDECVNMIKDFYLRKDITGAAEFIVEESSKRWRREEDVVDDITKINYNNLFYLREMLLKGQL